MDFSSFNLLLIRGVYYVIIAFVTFFSVFGVYILVRYGESRVLSFTVAGLYSVFYLAILLGSYHLLSTIS